MRNSNLCRVGKHTNIIMKPLNSPTQGEPNLRKIGLKSGIWATFPIANTVVFRGLGLVLYRKQTTSTKDVGCRSNFDPSRPRYTQDTSFSVKSSLTAVCQGVQTLSTDIFDQYKRPSPTKFSANTVRAGPAESLPER